MSDEDPLYVDANAMLTNKVGMAAAGIAIDLVFNIWWPAKRPFAFDPRSLTEFFQRTLPARGYTEDSFTSNAAPRTRSATLARASSTMGSHR